MFAQSDRPIGIYNDLGKVPGGILQDGERSDAINQGIVGPNPLSEFLPQSGPELAPPRGEDLVEESVTANRRDRLDEAAREPVVVHRKEVLRVWRHVVAVSRPTHTVTLGHVVDQPSVLESVQLLEHTRPAGSEMRCQSIR